jgi:hypothetical protein
MVNRRQPVGAWFAVAIAAIAAACSDRIVEGFTDRGVFGPAQFTDHSSANSLPVACLGALLLLRFMYLRVRSALRTRDVPLRAGETRTIATRALLWSLPSIFAVQIAGLWLMETAEQHLVVGHAFGGLIWLGGPAWFSLGVHAVICIVTALVARSVLRALEPRALRLIRALLSVLCTVGEDRRMRLIPRLAPIVVRPAFVLCRIGERAPPLSVS